MWAPCPFHHEKTASFHVDDQKGFYYCFGCHAKGDAISFVKETENVSFIEAVEILAREAGCRCPRVIPKAQEKQDRRSQLAEVMEQAVQFFPPAAQDRGRGSGARLPDPARAGHAGAGSVGDRLCPRWLAGAVGSSDAARTWPRI